MAKQKLAQIPQDIVSCADYQRHIKDYISPDALAFLEAGAADELTRDDNINAFREIKLSGHVLGDVSGGNTNIELFGKTQDHPLLLAPIGYQKLFHPRGEIETALAAKVTQTPMVVSSLSNSYLEDISRAHDGSLWFQLYYRPKREDNLDILNRAKAAGYGAIVITLDAPISGIRNREQRAGFYFPNTLSAVNLPKNGEEIKISESQNLVFDGLMKNAPKWSDIEWVIKNCDLPVILKGIIHPDDAIRAVDIGAKGIIISNHGGRILDGLPATISVLPAIKAAIKDNAKIIIDGGIRRGGDVFKSLALGADAAMIGRPYIYGLGVAGALGVAHIIRTLREELEITMAISGTKFIKEINSSHLHI